MSDLFLWQRVSWRQTLHAMIATFGLLLAEISFGNAGPPYLSDDPEPTDYQHYEIYAFGNGDVGATIIASTTAGTTMADFADRSLGIGYAGGSTVLFGCVLACLALWYWSQGTVSVATVNRPKVEVFYWATITFSQTLGTALGDWIAAAPDEDPPGMGLGYEIGALIFGALLVLIVVLYFWTSISRVLLFWSAFILTRPLGATVGDFLDKPLNHGGLALSRPLASAVLAVFIVGCILLLPQRPGGHSKANGERNEGL